MIARCLPHLTRLRTRTPSKPSTTGLAESAGRLSPYGAALVAAAAIAYAAVVVTPAADLEAEREADLEAPLEPAWTHAAGAAAAAPAEATAVGGAAAMAAEESESAELALSAPVREPAAALDDETTPVVHEEGSAEDAGGASARLAFAVPLLPPDALPSETMLPSTGWTPEPVRRKVAVGRGDTLMELLTEAGVERTEAHAAIEAMRQVFDPRRLRPGQEITLDFMPQTDADDRFVGFGLDLNPERSVVVSLDDAENQFAADEVLHPLAREFAYGADKIDSSLYVAGVRANLPPLVMVDLIHIFSFDIDFQRDIRAGDRFAVMYERFEDEHGETARLGEILYASLTLSGVEHRLWRYKAQDGSVDYYDEKGQSVRRALMRTPIDGARLSSGFGMRRHPILGYTKMHQGTDFAAPSGTPIYAAGDGVIERAGRHGGYGNYIRIRHNSTYKTAYAHMSRFASGMRAGKRVKQGQTIGYVGTTGRSTGPHLHYEVLRDGRRINAQAMQLPSGRKLKGEELVAFQATRGDLDQQVAALARSPVVTSASAAEADAAEADAAGSRP